MARARILIVLLILTLFLSACTKPAANDQEQAQDELAPVVEEAPEQTVEDAPEQNAVDAVQGAPIQNFSIGLYTYEAASTVFDGELEYTLRLWVRTNQTIASFNELYSQIKFYRAGEQVEPAESEKYILTSAQTAWGYNIEDPTNDFCDEVFLIPGIPVVGARSWNCPISTFTLTFKVPYEDIPTSLNTPIGVVELPTLSGDPVTQPIPAPTVHTLPYGQPVKAGDFELTVFPPELDRYTNTAYEIDHLSAILDLSAKPSSTPQKMNFTIFQQVVDEKGVMWNDVDGVFSRSDFCDQYVTDKTQGEWRVPSSSLSIDPKTETHNYFCFSIGRDMGQPDPSLTFSFILENVPYTFSAK